jgi:hypothetical protein
MIELEALAVLDHRPATLVAAGRAERCPGQRGVDLGDWPCKVQP